MRRFFEHPKHMFKLMGKGINAILGAQLLDLCHSYIGEVKSFHSMA